MQVIIGIIIKEASETGNRLRHTVSRVAKHWRAHSTSIIITVLKFTFWTVCVCVFLLSSRSIQNRKKWFGHFGKGNNLDVFHVKSCMKVGKRRFFFLHLQQTRWIICFVGQIWVQFEGCSFSIRHREKITHTNQINEADLQAAPHYNWEIIGRLRSELGKRCRFVSFGWQFSSLKCAKFIYYFML